MKPTLLTHRGKSQNIRQWSKELGIPHNTISGRLRKGMTVAEALSTDYVKPERKPVKRGLERELPSFDNPWRHRRWV